MAIAFARPEYVGRSDKKNACCKSSYNSRSRVTDQRTGKTFDFRSHGGNAYHEMLLPEYVDKNFENIERFSNEVERAEKRKDSQLYVEWLLALPKEKEISLEMKKEIIKEFIERKGWIKEGLGVQIDIHRPHEGEINWHAHLLVTTRRFKQDGLGLEDKKAVDLQPEIRYGKVQKTAEIDNHKFYESVLNDKFKAWGLDLRADLPGEITQEHIGPVRMRSVMNEAVLRNEERKEAEIKYLSSGSRVLEKVTKHMSVFSRSDLVRCVKYISDKDLREKLVEEALSNKSVTPLYMEEGSKTRYFTTESVRDEETKILRMSGYVANENNVFASSSVNGVNYKKELATICRDGGLSEEQANALRSLVLSDSGLRIMRGRAGSGKSYVLKQLPYIGNMAGVNVIGIAPTHKAKIELASDGFANIDTIKGMLFKLANGRFSLPKHSLIVVDEAGMVGNDDMKELMRVAATRKCNIILSGDERQLASVQRGGMFEVFADRYGSSSILDIQRQSEDWGKSVAMNMSSGNVESAISILGRMERIKWQGSSELSMNSLLSDWNNSEFSLSDRIILAVKNKDVAALNHGVREYLKLSGKLTGDEFRVGGSHYMQGDRILITKTSKELGLVNGDLAEIAHASEDRFEVRLCSSKNDVISFNPSEYSGFRHGYATTIFKAQGASIKDVYVYHDGFAGIRNSYVALSRNKIDLKLYANTESTADRNSLIRQLSHDAEAGSSLSYCTEKELESKRLNQNMANDNRVMIRGLNHVLNFVENTITKIADKYIPASEYYNYQAPKEKYESVSRVIEKTYSELEQEKLSVVEEKIAVGNYNNVIAKSNQVGQEVRANKVVSNYSQSTAITSSVNVKQSSKARFYANADRVTAQRLYAAQKEEWGREYQQLQSEIRFKAEYIARDLLGDPNKRLSNRQELRYGDHGKLAVRIAGEKAGTWYDFAKGEGGDLFHLVQDVKGCDFKESANYLRQSVGMDDFAKIRSNLQLVYDHRNKDLTLDKIKANKSEARLLEKKQAYSTKLYERSKDISSRSIAYKYLSNIRGINVDLGEDIKTAGIYSKEKKVYVPAMIAYARDKSGNITGGQYVLLSKVTNDKADVDIPKKSFGKVGGSFVNLGFGGNKAVDASDTDIGKTSKSEITVIAEGVETGLSVKQAMREHRSLNKERNRPMGNVKILCSLGISNIKNYAPSQGEKIIIAADNDGIGSITAKTISDAKSVLEERGAYVEIVRPKNAGADFNDVLRDSSGGSQAVADSFIYAINKHRAETIKEYITNSDNLQKQQFVEHAMGQLDQCNEVSPLTDSYQVDLAIIEKYNINQESIVDRWRSNPDKAREEMKSMASGIKIAEQKIEANRDILGYAANIGINIDKSHLIQNLISSSVSAEQECIESVLSGFAKQKEKAEKIGQIFNIIKQEDKFLSEVGVKEQARLDNNLQARIEFSQSGKSNDIMSSIKVNIEANHKQGVLSYDDLRNHILSGGYDIKGLDQGLGSIAQANRDRHLRFMKFDLSQLEKLGHKYDADLLVNTVKSMDMQGQIDHGKKLLAKHAVKYFNDALANHKKEKAQATDYNSFMQAITREHKTLLGLYEHRFAASAIDKHCRGKHSMLLLTRSAHDIKEIGGMGEVMKLFDHAIKNKLTDKAEIMSSLRKNGGNVEYIYNKLNISIKRINKELTAEHEKQQNVIPDKGSYYRVGLSFNNEPKKDTRKVMESVGMRFSKSSQRWEGRVKEHHVRKLTDSLLDEKYHMDTFKKIKMGLDKNGRLQELKTEKYCGR